MKAERGYRKKMTDMDDMDGTSKCGEIGPQHVDLDPLSPVRESARERRRSHLSPSPVSSPLEGGEQNPTCCNQDPAVPGIHPHSLSLSPGFTLLEVMVALAILALGLVTALELFAGSLRLGTTASRHTQAAIYAQNEMDRLLAQTTLDDGEESGELPEGYYWQVRVQEIYPEESQTRLQPQQQNPTDFFHLKEIEVRVSWQGSGAEQSLTLRSLRTIADQQINP